MYYRLHHSLLAKLTLVLSWVAVAVQVEAVSTVNADLSSVTVAGSRLVGLQESGKELLTSDDSGASFQSRHTMSDVFASVDALGTTVVAVGTDGLVLRSVDSGGTWASATAPSLAEGLYAAAGRSDGVNPNVWLAVGDDGFDGSIYRSADNALNWAEVAVLSDSLLRDVIWTGTRWLVCGSDGFDGAVAYSSTDGDSWTASTLPDESAPLLAMAHDGAGVVLAVGESGQILRSTDDGLNFSVLTSELISGDFYTVIYLNEEFYLGGDEKTVFQVTGTSVSVVVPKVSQGTPVRALVVLDGAVVAAGEFESAVQRTVPLDLILSVEGTADYRLTVSQALTNKTYFLEESIDLINWGLVEDSAIVGTGAATFFDVSEDGTQRFWRVAEF